MARRYKRLLENAEAIADGDEGFSPYGLPGVDLRLFSAQEAG